MPAGGPDDLLVLASLAVLLALVLPLAAWAAPRQETLQAQQRAEMLLREVLGDERYRQFREAGALRLPSYRYPGRTYVIRGREPVTVIERSGHTYRLCVQPVAALPEADCVLLHKLMLEASEEAYLAVAQPLDIPPLPSHETHGVD